MKKIDSFIFDLDGTLWNTIKQTFISFNHVLKKYNYDEVSEQRVRENFGNTKTETIKHFFSFLSIDKAEKLLDEIDNDIIKKLNSCDECYIYEGVKNVLAELSIKYDLYIVSNSAHKSYIESFIKSGKFDNYFKDYIAASEISLLKHEAILKIMKDNQIIEAVYVGDTNKDRIAAEKANIPFIQCLYGFDSDLKCDYKINNISELNNVIDKVFNSKGVDL